MAETKDIFTYVEREKTNYESGPGVPVAGDWNFVMFKHCERTMLMRNGQFPDTQTELGVKPNKNIILPILEVAHRSQDLNVKDIEVYVDDDGNYHLSLLARKFHNKWALDNHVDTFIDEVVEGLDYGFVLVKNVNESKPEVIQPQQIAFCNQTDILSGTIALKHQYSIDQLLDVAEETGWYKDEVNYVISKAREEQEVSAAPGQKAEVPDKSIEVYEVHGTFPETWLSKDGDDKYNGELNGDKYSKQLHIITFTKNKDGSKAGTCLFKGPESESIFKVLIIDPIFGRAAGRGRVEELFEAQVWTNFNMINMEEMLKNASKVVHITDDDNFTKRQNTKNVKSGTFLTKEKNTTVDQLNTQPINFNLFDRAANEWDQFARTTGSAQDTQLGVTPASGTPLGTTQIVTAQGVGRHERNRGKIASFIGEIYRDWVMGYLVKEMNKGDKWMDELDADELKWVAEKVSTKQSNKRIKELVLSGKMPTPEEQQMMIEVIKEGFKKGGKNRFFEIMKGEFKDLPLKVKINVAGKQKDLSRMADKLTNIFMAVFRNPQGFIQTMQIPGAQKAFNQMIEASGMNQFDFTEMPEMPVVSPIQPNNLEVNNNIPKQ